MKIKSLKLKIILLSTSVILFFGMLAILFVFFEGFSVLKKQGIQNLSEVTAVQTVALSTTFENARTRIDHLAHNNSVTPYLEHSEAESAADVLRHFELNNRDEVFSVIYLMDTDGLTLVSTDPRFTGNNYEFREYFQTAMTGETDVYTAKGVTSNEVGYYFSAPVYSASNTIIGVIVGKATPEYIHTPLEILADEEEDIMLTDDKGIVLYSKEEERLYASLGELTEEELSNIEDKRQYEGIKIESLGYKPVKEELDKASTTSIIEHDTTLG